MLTQAQIAQAWGPACRKVERPTLALNGAGRVTVDPRIVDAVRALNACLIAWNYRTRYVDTGAYVCRDKVGKPGEKSNHSYGTALDINWQTNPYGRVLRTDFPAAMREAILGIRTNNGQQVWGWGGNWSGNKDAMHWEVVCRPSDLATGIRGGVTPPHATPPVVAPKPAGPTAADLLLIQRLLDSEGSDPMVVLRDGKGIAMLVNGRTVGLNVTQLVALRAAFAKANKPLPEVTCDSDALWRAYTGIV